MDSNLSGSVADECLTEDETAAALKISKRTLQCWRKQKRVLPFHRIGEAASDRHKRVRYRRSDIEAYLAGTRISPTLPGAERCEVVGAPQ